MLFRGIRLSPCGYSGHPCCDPFNIIFFERGVLQTPAVTVSTIVTNVTTLVTEAVKWVGSFIEAITSNPLLLTFVIVSFVGLGVGLIKRLVKV